MTPLSEAHRRLSDAVRRATLATLIADVGDDAMDAAASAIEAAAAELEQAQRDGPAWPDGNAVREPHRFFPVSPVVGYHNPLALPVQVEIVDDLVIGTARFTWPYQGPPGCVHGAVVASVFDELLSFACIANGPAGMTGKLSIKYRHPTPLHEELRFVCRRESISGRRLVATGECYAGDVVTAEAEGLFITVRPDRAAEMFEQQA
ncbi:MAG TPA: PaaI family thioesterase [Mycobacteriales bacterium]|nr:PaaI family thioesterase [Mycobacteriales bacterium]